MVKRPLPPGVGRNRRHRTAMKLWLAVVVANVLGLFVAVYAAAAIRSVPRTEGLETAWQALYYGMIFLVGLIDALWLDEVLFHGAFRRTHIQGRRARSDDSPADVIATLQRSNVSFPFSSWRDLSSPTFYSTSSITTSTPTTATSASTFPRFAETTPRAPSVGETP